MQESITSKKLSYIFIILYSALIAILFYPFQLFFSGKWEVKSYLPFITIDEIKNKLGENVNNYNLNIILDFFQQNAIESFGVRYYSLTMFIGASIAFFLLIFYFKKLHLKEYLAEKIFVSSIFLGLIGARGLYILTHFEYYNSKPQEIFNFQQGGLSVFGGFLVVSLYFLIVSISNKIKLSELTDSAVPSFLTFLIWARLGNFFNYESYGLPYKGILKMYVPEGAAVNNRYIVDSTSERFYHPTFLYEIFACLLLLIFTMRIFERFAIKKSGLITGIFAIYYSLLRFYIDYIRLDVTRVNQYLTHTQLISVLVFLVGFIFLLRSNK
jgi:phosphatidylglycerol---prolipoprotein diacylglyceryl transferase